MFYPYNLIYSYICIYKFDFYWNSVTEVNEKVIEIIAKQ